jgi:hypothetical protein
MPMSDTPAKIVDWGSLYQDSLTTEILRSERRRARKARSLQHEFRSTLSDIDPRVG